MILSLAIFFSLDRYLKFLSLSQPESSVPLLGEWLKFSFTKNYYIAFSLPFSGPLLTLLLILVIICLIFAIFYLKKANNYSWFSLFPLTLIIFGAISNLTDRLIFNYVIDYFDCRYFTVFNLADVMITSGALLFLLNYNHKNSGNEKRS